MKLKTGRCERRGTVGAAAGAAAGVVGKLAPTTWQGLSPVSWAVWQWVTWYIDAHGVAPTVREIAAGCWMSKSSAGYHLQILERAGCIERRAGKHRSIWLLLRPEAAEAVAEAADGTLAGH